MNRHERAFRRLVRLYPAAFRAEYEDQLVGLFADQLRDAQATGRTLAVPRLWTQTLVDLVATAPREHLRKESPVLQPVEPTAARTTPTGSPLQRALVFVASVPLILWIAVWVVAPAFMEPVRLNPPAILGLPAGLFVMAFAGGIALFGWVIARRARTVGAALGALAFLSIPALLLIVMAPALIMLLVGLAGV